MVRRVVALGIVGVIVFGAVRVVGSLTSGDDPVADAQEPGTSTESTVVATDDDGLRHGSLATDPAGTADGATTVATVRSPTPHRRAPARRRAENPAKVYIVGDSDAGTFGPYLQTLLDGTNIVDTELNYKVSSGLARPDFFDWPAELEARCPRSIPTSSWPPSAATTPRASPSPTERSSSPIPSPTRPTGRPSIRSGSAR